MKQYVVDELRPGDFEKIKAYLDENHARSGVENLYWIELEGEILTKVQAAHTRCQPFCFAVEVMPERLGCELLVRTKNRMRCSCMQYANEKQRNWLIGLVDSMIDEIGLKV